MMMVVRPNIFEARLGRQSHIWASIFTQNTNDVDMNYEIFFKEIFDQERKEKIYCSVLQIKTVVNMIKFCTISIKIVKIGTLGKTVRQCFKSCSASR